MTNQRLFERLDAMPTAHTGWSVRWQRYEGQAA